MSSHMTTNLTWYIIIITPKILKGAMLVFKTISLIGLLMWPWHTNAASPMKSCANLEGDTVAGTQAFCFWQSCSLTSEQACQTRGSHLAMELAEMAFSAATCPDWQLTPHARSWMSQAVKVMTDKDQDQTLASRKKPPPYHYQRWDRPVLRAHRKWEFMGVH